MPDAQRIYARCQELARHSEQADGLTRVFLSREQRAVNELVLGWMRDAGMDARLDAIGNCVGRYEATTPGARCLMLGSHLDTVRDAGKYDGMLGVVAAIECVGDLHRAGERLPFAVEVVGFADEEGVRFGATLLGSRAVAGTFDPGVLDATDAAGISMRAAGASATRHAVPTNCWRTRSCTSSRGRYSKLWVLRSALSPRSTAATALSSTSPEPPVMPAPFPCTCDAMR